MITNIAPDSVQSHFWSQCRNALIGFSLFTLIIVSVQASHPYLLLLCLVIYRIFVEIIQQIYSTKIFSGISVYFLRIAINSLIFTFLIYFGGPHAPTWLFGITTISIASVLLTIFSPTHDKEKNMLSPISDLKYTKIRYLKLNYWALGLGIWIAIHHSVCIYFMFGNLNNVTICFVTLVLFAFMVNIGIYLIREISSHYQLVLRNRELEIEKTRAVNENEQKTVFIAKMSHELRTPLHAIINCCDLVNDTSLDTEQKKFMQIIGKSSNLLLGLINNILDLSKYETGHMKLDVKRFNFKECIRNVITTMKMKQKITDCIITLKLAPSVPDFVIGDEIRLTQVLINFIGNGLKFQNRNNKPVVQVEVFCDDKDTIGFDITDNGIGIPIESRNRLFGNFARLDAGLSRSFEGTGLGLSICKNVIEYMGGRAFLKRSEVGIGSTFSFEYKIIRDDTPDDSENQSNILNLTETELDLSTCKILVAEDNSINRRVMARMLNSIGVKDIVMVENGLLALDEFEKIQFDIIILDVNMPVMSGIEAAKLIRLAEFEGEVPMTPIVACTADVTEEQGIECLRAGMDIVVTKPIVKNALKAIITKLLMKSKETTSVL